MSALIAALCKMLALATYKCPLAKIHCIRYIGCASDKLSGVDHWSVAMLLGLSSAFLLLLLQSYEKREELKREADVRYLGSVLCSEGLLQ